MNCIKSWCQRGNGQGVRCRSTVTWLQLLLKKGPFLFWFRNGRNTKRLVLGEFSSQCFQVSQLASQSSRPLTSQLREENVNRRVGKIDRCKIRCLHTHWQTRRIYFYLPYMYSIIQPTVLFSAKFYYDSSFIDFIYRLQPCTQGASL